MFRSMWMRTLPAAALILGGLAAEAKVELAPVFSDNAVLQRDVEVPVWGFADPGESVTVKFADQTKTTTAGDDGKWMVKLSPLAASKENRTLEASDEFLETPQAVISEQAGNLIYIQKTILSLLIK